MNIFENLEKIVADWSAGHMNKILEKWELSQR